MRAAVAFLSMTAFWMEREKHREVGQIAWIGKFGELTYVYYDFSDESKC